MDTLYRIVRLSAWFVLGVLIGGLSLVGSVKAETTPASPRWPLYPTASNPAGTTSGQAMCVSYWASVPVAETYYGTTQCSAVSGGGGLWQCVCAAARYGLPVCPAGQTCGQAASPMQTQFWYCDASQGWTLSGTNCFRPDCLPGEVRGSGGVCVAESPCVAGNVLSSGYYDVGTSPTASVPAVTCSGGCLYSFSGYCPAGVSGVGGIQHYYCKGSYGGMGAGAGTACAAPPAASASIPGSNPSQCGPGQCWGYVGEVGTCVPCGSTSSTTVGTKTTTTDNPDGTKTSTTETTTTSSGPGGITERTTTTTGTTAGSGAATGEGTSATGDKKSQDTASFCQENPEHALCKGSTVSGGADCGAAPSCSGDAAQCAIVVQTWNTRCSLAAISPDDATSQKGAGIITADSDRPEGHPGLTPETSDFSTVISQERFLSPGGLSDLHVTVMGHDVTVPFSAWDDALVAMGYVVVAFSLIAAARIVGGA